MKKTSAILVVVLLVTMLLQTVGLAWISDNGLSSLVNITGNVHKHYFEYGDGTTEATPYGIANQVQLYYFAWLQYLGYFNVDNDGDGVLDTVYFELDPNIEGELDMTGYKLPPIGTTDNPFIGNFDGNGKTISNLTVKNWYSDLSAPPNNTENFDGAEIIGFFGVVGGLSDDYKYSSSANEVKNLALKNLTIETQTEKSLIGLVAGYVNGTVDCVGVLGGTINIADGVTALTYTKNISDYSLIGFCTNEYKDSVYVMDITISRPGVSDSYNVVPDMTSDGEGHGWGGSVKMSDIYTWLTTVKNNAPTSNSYIMERVDVIDLSGKIVTADRETASKKTHTQADFGSFVFSTASSVNYVNFVAGGQKVDEFKYQYTDEAATLYYITDGEGNYLALNGTNVTSTNQANARAWYVDQTTDGEVIYTVIDNVVYYLDISGSTVVVTSCRELDDYGNPPAWDRVDGTYALDGYKLEFVNGGLGVAKEGVRIYYTEGNGTKQYIRNNGTNQTFQSTTDPNLATLWTMTANGSGYTFSTIVGNNNTPYYIRCYRSYMGGSSYTLQFSQTSTTWTYNGTQMYYTYNRTNYYLQYNGGWTVGTNSANIGMEEIVSDATANKVASGVQDAKKITLTTRGYIDNSAQNGYYDANGEKQSNNNLAGITYFPLSSTVSGNSYAASSNNTGYIIGAEWDDETFGQSADSQDGNSSNLRISQYLYTNTSMAMDLEDALATYAISYNTGNEFVDVSGSTADELKALGLVKYAACYGDYATSVQTGCNGLHFMDAPIMIENVTEITAHLNGSTKNNYQVPTNCIDFNLYERGFINAFAGTYYQQRSNGKVNDSFFSIYQIFRDPQNENKITAIKEISAIYAVLKNGEIDTSIEYIYKYTDGSYSGDITSNKYKYDQVFDCKWITHSDEFEGWDDNRAYYFEVPVNAGEYAIGSTEGRTGAYLVYLDLAANAQIIERQKDYEQIVEEKYAGSLPKGVELLAPDETLENGVDPTDSAFVSINAAGEIVFSTVDGVTITHTAKDGTSAEYIGPNNTLLDGNGVAMTMPSERTTIYQTTYRDHNLNTGEYTVTVITETHKSDGTVTYERTITKGTWNSETNAPENMGTPETMKSETEKLYPTTKDSVENEGGGAIGADLVGLYFAYGQKDSLTVKYEYTYDATNPTYNITITVTNEGGEDVDIEDVDIKAVLKSTTSGVTVYINGQELESTTDPQTVTVTVTSGGDATQ